MRDYGRFTHGKGNAMNTAARLKEKIVSVFDDPSGNLGMEAFCAKLGVPIQDGMTPAMASTQAYGELVADCRLLLKEIHKHCKQNEEKLSLFLESYEQVQTAISSLVFMGENRLVQYQPGASTAAIVGLKFIAMDLPNFSDSWTDSEIEKFQRLLNELNLEIDRLPVDVELKEWLLGLTRIMSDSVRRYKSRGPYGMRDSLAKLLVELMVDQQAWETVKKSHSTVFEKFMSLLGVMQTAATVYEGGKLASIVGTELLKIAQK